jgi:hypothetical protein
VSNECGGGRWSFPLDANGHFAFADLEPGTYILRAFADGYARQEFNPGTRSGPGMTAEVTLAAGTASRDTVFRLIPGGTVSGRVTGSSGEPLVNLEVTLLRRIYDPDGRRTFQQVGLAQTNDRGEYRLFWVTPGRYYPSVEFRFQSSRVNPLEISESSGQVLPTTLATAHLNCAIFPLASM